MSERPIIFDANSVRGIRRGNKRNTLRAVVPPGSGSALLVDADRYRLTLVDAIHGRVIFEALDAHVQEVLVVSSPYGGLDDHLWVKETFAEAKEQQAQRVYYREAAREREERRQWTSPIYMPRWASRMLLVIESLSVMRVQEITTAQIRAEGVDDGRTNATMGARHDAAMRMAFAARWDEINGRRKAGALAWARNPWVWSIGFSEDGDDETTSEEEPNDAASSAEVIPLDRLKCERCKLPIRSGDLCYEVSTPRGEVKVHKACLEGTAERSTP